MADNNQNFGAAMPGSNPGGTNVAVPTPASSNTPAIGGSQTPFGMVVPSGSQTAPITSPTGIPMTALPGLTGLSGSPGFDSRSGGFPSENDFIKAFRKAGFSAGDAGLLFNFIQSGSGFNPQVATSMINAMNQAIEPVMSRGESDILEQFGSQGLRNSSSAAIGMGDFLSSLTTGLQMNEATILKDMYQQSVSNYMQVMLAGKGPAPKSTFDHIIDFMNALPLVGHSSGSGAPAPTPDSGGSVGPTNAGGAGDVGGASAPVSTGSDMGAGALA